MIRCTIAGGRTRAVVTSEGWSRKILWKETRREYVFKTTTLPTGRRVEIPVIYAIRATTLRRLPIKLYRVANHTSTLPPVRVQQSSQLLDLQASYWNLKMNDCNGFITARNFSQRVTPNRKLETTDIPIPASSPPVQANPLETLKKTTPKGLIRKGLDLTIHVFQTIINFLLKLPGNTYYYITHPKERQEAIEGLGKSIKHEVDHYWNGTKLLWAEIQTAQSLLHKTLRGSALTRRERRQLLRTVSDLFRLVPFSMFVIIPFMEFTLPFALRIFPNLLPSTYQDSLKAEENMKRELKTRIAMAQFFQETLEELAKEQKQKASKRKQEMEDAGVIEDDGTISNQRDSASSMLEFLAKARNGDIMPPDVIIRYAKYFQDDLTLDNMPRMQLINMCRYMGIAPYGNDNFLRFQLRMKIRGLKEDDQKILWEGIDSLTKMELREACQERGMISTGLSKDAYKRNLQQWLDLSVNKDVPISLLIMSRTFFLRDDAMESHIDVGTKSLTGLADAISGLDKDVVNEVILEVATAQEKISNPDVRKIKLEVLSQQNELIKAEQKAREEVAKKKESAEKEKLESEPMIEPSGAVTDSVEASSGSPSSALQESVSIKMEPLQDAASPSLLESSMESEKPKIQTKEQTLSTDEMDAISQLISQDPVSSERAELEKIKAAMKTEAKTFDTLDKPLQEALDSKPPVVEDIRAIEDSEKKVSETITQIEKRAELEAEASTIISTKAPDQVGEEPVPTDEKVTDVDPVVARLKKSVESMVGKIEAQLTETEVKIGDKLHFLDKDKDGILTREEMASVLQSVLKRPLSFDDAMKIAAAVDENKDGVFSVAELNRWINENKLAQFFAEERDADIDRIVNSLASQKKQENNVAAVAEPEETPQKQAQP